MHGNPNFPRDLFSDCHIELNMKINGNEYHFVSKVQDYDRGQSKYFQSSLDCEFRICTVANMAGLAYQRMVKKRKGRPAAAKMMTPICSKVFNTGFQQI